MKNFVKISILLLVIFITTSTIMASEIYDEIKAGNLEKVKELIQKDPSVVNETDSNGETPLYRAIIFWNKEIAGLLILKGADISVKNKKGLTPFDTAILYCNKDAVEFLLSKGVKDNLFSAVVTGDKKAAEKLLSSGADVNCKDSLGSTPLMFTCVLKTYKYPYGKEMAEFFLSKGAEVNIKNNDGLTPLSTAVCYGDKDIMELLISKGARINDKASDGSTPLHKSIKTFEYGFIDKSTFKDITELLISKGADVDDKDNDGLTPLHTTSEKGYKDIAELLISKDATVNVKDNGGLTPLQIAVENGYKDIAELLISKGADVNVKDKKGFTPLHTASENGYKDIAELLISKGADVNAKDKEGYTPLYFASDISIINLLKSAGGTLPGENDLLTICESHIKNLATALEMYSTDNWGAYPFTLEELTKATSYGSYMKELPVCPACEKPYIYEGVKKNPDDYMLKCGGENAHKDTGKVGEGHYPMYTPGTGLIEKE